MLRKAAADSFDEPQRDPLLDEFHIDTEAILADEARAAPAFSPTYDEAMGSNNAAIAEAASAVAEFEHDMAASEDIPEIQHQYQAAPAVAADEAWQTADAASIEDLQAELRRRFLKALKIEDCRGQRLVPLREMLQNLQS